MKAEETFDIEVEENNQKIILTVRRKDDSSEMKYDIFNDREVLLFTLKCCTNDVRDTYKLSAEFEDKKIDPELIQQVNQILMSEEE